MHIDQLNPVILARLIVIDMQAPLQAAAHSLTKPGIGLVVVCNERGKAEGVLSKSDLIRHLAGREPATTSVAALMSRNIVACNPHDDLHVVWQTMTAQRLQNMPVLGEDAEPLGVLDIRDAMKMLFEQEEIQERMMSNYIAGLGYQ